MIKANLDETNLKEKITEERAKTKRSDLIFYAVLAVLVILAVLLKVFVIANYTVSGTSMEPTLSAL